MIGSFLRRKGRVPARSLWLSHWPKKILCAHIEAQCLMHFVLDCRKHPYYVHVQLRSLRGISGGDPEGGARRGVPRRRLTTVVPGGTGPRPPGTTTWLRGARCTDPEEMPEKEAWDRSLKSPRWSAGRRASRVMGRKAPR